MSLSFSLSLLAVSVLVRAETGTGSASQKNNSEIHTATATTTPKTDGSKTTGTETETKSTTDDSSARAVRLEGYKKLLKETMSATAKARIAERCVAAQAQVKVKITHNSTTSKIRTDAYDKFVTDLEALSVAAKVKGANITTLQTSIAELKIKIVAFKTSNTTYQQSLSDLSILDCKTDPTSFKAALEVARANQTSVYAASQAVRSYLTSTVKPAIEAIKTALESANN